MKSPLIKIGNLSVDPSTVGSVKKHHSSLGHNYTYKPFLTVGVYTASSRLEFVQVNGFASDEEMVKAHDMLVAARNGGPQ